MFRGRGFRGFRPRNSTSQGIHLATLTLIGVVSEIKVDVMEVTGKPQAFLRHRNALTARVFEDMTCSAKRHQGYYIFNEPLKQAAIEVRAKEGRERAAAGRESNSSSIGSSARRSGGGGSSSSDLDGGGGGSDRL